MLPKRHVRTFLVHLVLVQNRFPDTSVSAAGVLLVSCCVYSEMRQRLTVDPFIIWVAGIHLVILSSQAWIWVLGLLPIWHVKIFWDSHSSKTGSLVIMGIGQQNSSLFWKLRLQSSVFHFVAIHSQSWMDLDNTWSNPLMACFIMWWNYFPSAYSSI